MVNLNEIKSINDAKENEYNGKKLTESEKTIFSNILLLFPDNKSLVKKFKDKIDSDKVNQLDEIKNTALLLDKTKEAEVIQSRDSLSRVLELLNVIKNAKNEVILW